MLNGHYLAGDHRVMESWHKDRHAQGETISESAASKIIQALKDYPGRLHCPICFGIPESGNGPVP